MLQKAIYEGFKGRKLVCYEEDLENPTAVILVVHGMQEHALRYKGFASELKKAGIKMFISDLRGHGANITTRPGLDDGDIYQNIVEDYKIFIGIMKQKHPGCKIYLFGHSFGSFVVQRFVRDNLDMVDKVIVCGSSYMNTPLIKAGKVVADISKLFKGRDADAKLMEKLSIRSYGKDFEDGNWLSRDEEVWNRYRLDPLCGKVFPVAFYQSMSKNVAKNYKGLNKNADVKTPILLVAGDNDPVGEYGKGVKKLYDVYKKAGLNVSMKLYKGARHEILNEINKKEVISDILDFCKDTQAEN